MLAVVTAPPAEDRALVGGRVELCVGEYGRDRRAIFLFERPRIDGDTALDQLFQRLIDLEQLGHEAPSPSRTVHSDASSR